MHLFKLIPVRDSGYSTRSIQNLPFFKTRHNFWKKFFFSSAIIKWNNLDLHIRNSNSLSIFKNNILEFIRTYDNSTFNGHNPKGIIIRLTLVLSLLLEYKFKHSFQNFLNPIRNSRLHYLRHCSTYNTEIYTLLSTLIIFDNNLLDLTEPILTKTLLFGSNYFDINTNTNILNATIEHGLSTKRYDSPLFE